MQTFAVSDVAPAERPLETITLERALAGRLAGLDDEGLDDKGLDNEGLDDVGPDDKRPLLTIEASGTNQEHLVHPPGFHSPAHPLVEAVHTAFANHYPLMLSPDDVWLCLAQGFAMHVEANAETLRSRFVRHEGRLVLEVTRHEFVKGSPDNDWQGCFAEWSDQIAAHIGKKRDLVVASFSTTGPIERAASELVLMSAMKSYFSFLLTTRCGIPSVTLLGTVEDWRAIRRRAEVLAEFDLMTDWMEVLLPVLDQLVAAATGNADRKFWQSIYKQDNRSGGPFVTGWINVLFPYLDGGGEGPVRNEHALRWSQNVDRYGEGTPLGSFPRGLSEVPFVWDYLKTKIPMTLWGGYVGISQDRQTRAVRPAIGWAVSEAAQDADDR